MIIKAPDELPVPTANVLQVFLAGSIESGSAIHWQKQVEDEFVANDRILILNPRRDDWDESWKQEKDDPEFNKQVNWELAAMEQAELIVMYFATGTQSPVTLLELGLYARSGKLIVCCANDFWRKGNVDIVCERYGVKQLNNIEELIESIYYYKNDNK